MKSNIWAKTILTSYKFLERICDAIDRMVETKALSSFNISGINFSANNVYTVTNKLIELGERKKILINLKILTETALKKCDEFYAQLLIEKYIDKESVKDIITNRSMPMRTYFRKMNLAETQFLTNLSHMGYEENTLANLLAGEKWITEIYSKFSTETREDCFEISEARLKKLAAI